MPDVDKQRKIAAAKRKLRKFKQKKGHTAKFLSDDASSLASEEAVDENVLGDGAINTAEPQQEKPNRHHEHIDSEIEHSVNKKIDNVSDVRNDTSLSVLDNFDQHNEARTKVQSTIPSTERVEIYPDDAENHLSNDNLASSDEVNTSYSNNDMSVLSEFDPLRQENTSKETLNQDTNNIVPTEEQLQLVENVAKLEQLETNELQQDEEQMSSATAEKLFQISTKLNGLAEEAQQVMSGENGISALSPDRIAVTELENRNQQLAEHVSSLTRQKQELLLQVQQLTQQMTELHRRLETEKQQIYSHGVNEQNTLRQQLQVQMQTISILVAEKQELQHQIHEARSSVSQEQSSRQKYQDQLQDHKLRIQTLERELQTNSESVKHLSSTKAELKQDRDQLQTALHRITKSNEETTMHVSELSLKLTAKEEECNTLTAELEDLHEKLSMAEVLLQQLSNTPQDSNENQLKQIQEDRESLNLKLIEYQQAFQQLTTERDQLSTQYEDATEQMKNEVAELSKQVLFLEEEKSDLQAKVDQLQAVIEEFEKNNEKNENIDQITPVRDPNLAEELQFKLQQVTSNLEQAVAERDEANHKLHQQYKNNENLARLNEEQEKQLSELNRNVTDAAVSADEHSKLLEQSQNDKATISRALTQNKMLKQQLEEMQNEFVKLTNDKMELASQLATTNHLRKKLEEEVEEKKVLLMRIEDKLRLREVEVEHQQHESVEVKEETAQTESNDANESLAVVERIQTELTSSRETVSLLGEQNAQLKSMVTRLQQELDDVQKRNDTQTSGKAAESDETSSTESSPEAENNSDTVALLSTSLQHVESERNELAKKLEEVERQHAVLHQQYIDAAVANEAISPAKYQQLQDDMALLQDRFTTIMKERVDALNKVEDLEHINLQLQNECDTIGEYITLYHNQRQVLKQRHYEKDEYVSSMAREREQMQAKLEKLQSLVYSLLNAREAHSPPPSPPLLASSPMKGRDGNNEDTSIQSVLNSEWPDMFEEEDGKPSITPRPDLLPDQASFPSTGNLAAAEAEKTERSPATEHFPGKLERVEEAADAEANTANQIISLLEQMQKPSVQLFDEVPQGFCLRYMGPYTAI